MTPFETATTFFHACESLKGWEGCHQYAMPNATFSAQSEPIADITTLEGYTDWMKGFGSTTTVGATYDLHSASYDESTKTAIFFGTFNGTHNGDGGPVPPTNKTTHSEYVYILTMNDNGLIERMVKVWNAPWAMKELGWL